MGLSGQWQKSELIFEHKDIVQNKSLIYVSMGIALVGENGGVIGEVWNKQDASKNIIKGKYT